MDAVTIETNCGPIIGQRKGTTVLFAGIPYAAPPIEALRFRAPMPHAPWINPREALKFGPAAPQLPTGGMTSSAPVRWNEDCLTLNVATPDCDDDLRPVLVWIHGGGYRTGQSSIPWYNGAKFNANGNIVVVSINYRLGALGFADLSHLGDAYATSSVNGLLDQIAALRWVQDNIAHFGGDPAQVTIAGESAGGFSVATLLGCAQAQGLFTRAIPQSGAAHHTLPKESAEAVTRQLFENLGFDDPVSLQAASVDEILAAQTTTTQHFESGAGVTNALGTSVAPFYPAHGNTLLPVSPLEAIRSGTGKEVAVLTGSNADETTLWGYGNVSEDKLNRIAASLGASETLTTYRKTRATEDAETLLLALTTDHMFRIPAVRLAEARAAHTDKTWMYLFNWKSRAFEGRLGATHALEIPFAFDNLDQAGVDAFIGPGEAPQHVATTMHNAWIEFIHGRDPGWLTYNLEQRPTMIFDDESSLVHDPHAEERLAWENLR